MYRNGLLVAGGSGRYGVRAERSEVKSAGMPGKTQSRPLSLTTGL